MLFNFKLFSRLAERAYNNIGNNAYSLEEVLAVFEYYFDCYEKTFKEVHSNINIAQIERIIRAMPYMDRLTTAQAADCDIEAEIYEDLINKHFKTQYKNCDYNINHFFSGDIRLMRYYEEIY